MRYTPLIILLVLIPFVVAEDNFIFDHTLYSTNSVTLDVAVTNEIAVSGNVQEVIARLYYYPKNYDTQRVTNINNNPQARQEPDHYMFQWYNPRNAVSFTHTSTVQSQYHQPRITERIDYPYEYIPPEVSQHLSSEEIIRITPRIRKQAEDIIGDETDAMRIAYLLGSWVKENIEYDLSSVALKASYPSDWVLENRQGVCDELTSLFIAMLRSQGIPARFVSGVAYTNLEVLDTNWGPHGWAEVWFPEVGWVPYDVTYGQYGFVDATHIAVQKTVDATSNAAEYSMRGRGGDFDPQPLQRDFTLTDRGTKRRPDIDVTLTPALDQTGFGSYNRIDVDIRNLQSHYVSADLFFGRTNNLISEQEMQSILLEPSEQKTLYWYVQVDEDLEPGYQYTFPVIVTSNVGEREESSFRVVEQGIRAQRKDIAIQGAVQTRGLAPDIECEYPKTVMQEEIFHVNCTYPEVVNFCLEWCEQTDQRSAMFSFDRLGAHTTTVTASRGQSSTQRVLTFIVVDDPALDISLDAPQTVSFEEELVLETVVEKTSVSNPENITITLEHPLFYEEFVVEKLDSRHTLQIRLPAKQLAKNNVFTVTASYENQYGTQTSTANTHVQVTPRGFMERVTLGTNAFFGWVGELFA